MSDPPADILRRLRPIPTSTDHPLARPHDVRGTDPAGRPVAVDVVEAAEPVLLLFLSAGCLGCRDLWEGLAEIHAGLDGAARLAVVTRSAGGGAGHAARHAAGDEDPAAIAELAGPVPSTLPVALVMSTEAYADYRISGPPFMVVTGADRVLAEGVAWGVDETLRTARAVLQA